MEFHVPSAFHHGKVSGLHQLTTPHRLSSPPRLTSNIPPRPIPYPFPAITNNQSSAPSRPSPFCTPVLSFLAFSLRPSPSLNAATPPFPAFNPLHAMSNQAQSANVLTLVDIFGDPYFSYDVNDIPANRRPRNLTNVLNATSFLSETLSVRRQATNVFSTDLTARDDVILAVLSILLLFAFEGILTTILLRTYRGRVSTVGFSIKHFVELARDFQFRFLLVGRAKTPPAHAANRSAPPRPVRKINIKLLIVASLILSLSIGVEAVLLFLTTPTMTDVTNAQAAFAIEELIIPDWNQIRKYVSAALTRPCNTLKISGVEQGSTRITACLFSNGGIEAAKTFRLSEGNVNLTFITDFHDFGGEHTVQIGDLNATFRSRVYFNLGDSRRKMMRKRTRFFNRDRAVLFMHKQYVAYLVNWYRLRTGDTTLDASFLQSLNFNFNVENGDPVDIIKISNHPPYRQVQTLRHKTVVTGRLPCGPEALRFATVVLKASTAVTLRGPALNDLDMGSGSTWPREDLMWQESTRSLNWLSLTILLAAAIASGFALRYLLKPIGTAEIAGVVVRKAVGADLERSPIFMDVNEKADFDLPLFSEDAQGTDNDDSSERSWHPVVDGHSNDTYSEASVG
eukprot:GFKZ01005970.1.p1 GENE.GFKZ01005970.1~~GFKZ01005970.1.p1  ORF type:complete len:624 (+),score=63.95 GFKZ01005970.1:124-1995(+)